MEKSKALPTPQRTTGTNEIIQQAHEDVDEWPKWKLRNTLLAFSEYQEKKEAGELPEHLKSLEKTDDDVVEVFKSFREQCKWFQEVSNIYEQFDPDNYKGDGSVKITEVLVQTAPNFFSVIFYTLHQYIVLQVARITDEKCYKQNNNLSISYIDSLLEEYEQMTDRVKELSESLRKYGKFARNTRNKIIAHADKNTILKNRELGGHTAEERTKFFDDLHEYIYTVGEIIGVSPIDFKTIGYGPGYVDDLITHLKAGVTPVEDKWSPTRQGERFL